MTLDSLARHGSSLLFAAVLAEQLGLPLPAAPVLLAAGALARDGRMGAAPSLALALTASLIGHLAWYFAGRLRGARVLRILCQISLEPDSCVRRTQQVFADRGALTLILAPWLPGIGGIAPPLAGMSRMGLARFIAVDGLGSLLWAAAYIAAGYLFANQIDGLLRIGARLGGWFALAAVVALAVYVAVKFLQRRRVLRDLALARIEPRELKELLDRGDELLIVDLRHPHEFSGGTLPGAVALGFEELEVRAAALPRERDVVLYCS
jgi:membrane protein DedA with SNARE-associated domain